MTRVEETQEQLVTIMYYKIKDKFCIYYSMRCSVCGFETKYSTNFRKHLEGVPHETACQKILACKKCLQIREIDKESESLKRKTPKK